MKRIQHYIFEIYKERSFSRAAQNLYISQSSLSLMVKKHEGELGIQIFDRSTAPIGLTDVGEVYLESLRKILAVEAEMDSYLQDYHDMSTGTLTLGAPHFFSCFLLPPLIASFHRRYPGIKINLNETDSLRLSQQLLEGEIELLIESFSVEHDLFQSYPLLEERILLAVPSDDPANVLLQDRALQVSSVLEGAHLHKDFPSIFLSDFQQHAFLLLEKGHDMYSRAVELCEESGFQPVPLMTLKQLLTTYNLTGQQMGISFVSDTVVRLSGPRDTVRFYKLDSPTAKRHIHLAHKKNRYLSKPMKAFLETARHFFQPGLQGESV